MRRFRIVTFNVFHDYPLQRHADERLGLLVDSLVRERPDVVLLQEMFISDRLGHWTERLVSELRSNGLGYESFYAPANGSFAENGVFEEGSAILSRFPIVGRERRLLAPDHPVRRTHGDYAYVENRIALRATLEIEPGARLDVFNAHVTDAPPPPGGPSPRALQVEDLARFVAARPSGQAPAIVGGDLNAEPDAEEIRRLAESGFIDPFGSDSSFRTSDSRGRRLEYPADTADRRIDYVFLANVAPEDLRVYESRPLLASPADLGHGRFLWASDHNGLFVDCSFT